MTPSGDERPALGISCVSRPSSLHRARNFSRQSLAHHRGAVEKLQEVLSSRGETRYTGFLYWVRAGSRQESPTRSRRSLPTG